MPVFSILFRDDSFEMTLTICFFVSPKKETLARVFSYEFCEDSKNTFSTEQLRATASVGRLPHPKK